jgi:glucose/arabinose dehydrogenase
MVQREIYDVLAQLLWKKLIMRSGKYFIYLCLMALFFASCSSDPLTQEEPKTASVQAITDKTAEPVVATSEPKVASKPPTPTQLPTVAVQPTATDIPVSPTATAMPALHFDVDQLPYKASDCSDKYPCNDDADGWENRLQMPPGFEASYFARVDDFPTSLTFGPDGLLYVAGRSGTVYTVDDRSMVKEYATGLLVPTGIAFNPINGKLYASSRVTDTNVGGEGQVSVFEEGKFRPIIDGLPCCYIGMHGPNGIAFDVEGFGFVGVGGRADHGEILVEPNQGEQDFLQSNEAAILRFSPDGQIVEVYARGFRNPYDIAWDSQGNLYATDNGRDPDPLTGESPPDEVHLVIPGGEHGYPYYECSTCFGIPEDVDVIPPILELVPHGAVTGITAYQNERWPEYHDDLFIVLWSAFEGAQKVIRMSPDSGESSDFATGFAQPIDVTEGPDGSLYVADYATGIILKITFPE